MNKFEAPDFTKAFEDFIKSTPADFTAFTDMFKNTAEFTGKFSQIALDAAEKNAELSHKFTKDTLAKLEAVTKVQKEPADYAKVVSEFTSAQAQIAPERIAAFAEIAKKAQKDTVDLVMTAGKDAQADVSKAVKKAGRKAA